MFPPDGISIVRRPRQATRGRAPRPWSVVLAAGGSRRLGRPKQLVRLGRTTLVAHSVRLALHVTPGRVVVVVGADALRVRAHLSRLGLAPRYVHNGAWRHGQSTSLRRGIECLPRAAAAALVLVVDQPHLSCAALERLLAAWRRAPSRAAASEYSGRSGVPAVFPRSAFRALKRQTGDRGARALLQDPAGITRVPLPEAAFDVDTLEDLARL